MSRPRRKSLSWRRISASGHRKIADRIARRDIPSWIIDPPQPVRVTDKPAEGE